MNTPPGLPDWLQTAVVYNIFPSSFQDGNGDGIGDLAGITTRLPYLRELGANVIWLNPVFDSPFGDAGYDVRDYRAIAPRFGTMHDFDVMLARAHELGVRVLLDFVPGHTSVEHPWFQASASAERTAYDNWFVWTDRTFAPLPGNVAESAFVGGYGARDGRYMTNFFWFQPALNYGFAHPQAPWQLPVDHPDVLAMKAAMRQIMVFWLDRGVDGFRVDMAHSLVKGNDRDEAMKAHWQGERAWLAERYPHAALISEWSYPLDSIACGFHVDFLIHTRQAAYTHLFRMEEGSNVFPSPGGESIFRLAGGGRPDEFWRVYEEHLNGTRALGYISVPSGNHDFPRLSFGRTMEELKTAFTFLLTLPGVPTIYYGDEIGLRNRMGLPSKEGAYSRTCARTPMQWDRSGNLGFSTAAPEALYLPVDDAADAPNVADQVSDPASLLNHVRSLLRLRREHPALQASGDLVRIESGADGYPLCFMRHLPGQAFLTVVNPTAQAREVVLALPESVSARHPRRLSGPDTLRVERTGRGFVAATPPVSSALFAF